MSLMSSLYVGKSGLSGSQYAINTTAHNLSNVETSGFIRQQTIFGTTQFNTVGQSAISKMQVGLGVNTETVMQVRAIFLDKAYRQEIGREDFYNVQYEAVTEVEDIFGELNGVAFQDTIVDFWESLQELAKEPESIVTRASFVETAFTFVERGEKIYNQIAAYQLSLNGEIEEKVNRINEIGDEIVDLNKRICAYESNKMENANDLRDRRNSLLDELAEFINISYKEDMKGMVSVYAENVPFVTDTVVTHMSTMTQLDYLTRELKKEMSDPEAAAAEASRLCKNSNMLVPIWPMYGNMAVFNFDRAPSAEANTNIGGLKGLLLCRGSKIADYTDIPIKPKEEDFTDEEGYFDEDAFREAEGKFTRDLATYNNRLEPSAIMTIQAQFDQLFHGVVTMINDLLCPNTEYTLGEAVTIEREDGTVITYPAGTTVQIFDRENAPEGMDADRTMGAELFARKSMPRYEEVTLSDGTEIWIYNEEDPGDNYSLYTLGEVEVNNDILADKSKIPLSKQGGTGEFDITTVEKIITAWGSDFATLSPNTLDMNDYEEYYNSFIAAIANRGENFNSLAKNQEMVVQEIDSKRLSTTAVSSDEELTNLIKFQHAYNAAARYINVVDEMLELIVTRL